MTLGFPPCLRAWPGPPAQPAADAVQEAGAGSGRPVFEGRDGFCAATVCTRNHIHFARALTSSFQAHHPGVPVFVLVADWDGAEPLAAEGATLLPGSRIVGPPFDYMALKYSASDLCCALKPYLLNHLVEETAYRKILYLDSDIFIFAPLEKLIAPLDDHNFTVTPHIFSPMPNPERFWERPTIGEIALSGTLNAGMFGLRVIPETRAFLETWQQMVTVPGAFLADLGSQMEQNAFNWLPCFSEGVHFVRDRAYNAAYWNLHDRSLRYRGLDAPGEESWAVDGEPLVAYHFSGFSLDAAFKVSRYDQRYSLYVMPSLSRLFDFYAARLREHGGEEARLGKHRYDHFPSGVAIDARMRYIYKCFETFLRSELSPWTPEGEAYYCEALLSPVPYQGNLIPILFQHVYVERVDLQQAFPEAPLHPAGFMRWIAAIGIYESGYQEIFDRYRPVLPSRHGMAELTPLLRDSPALFAGLEQPMAADRGRLIARLEGAGLGSLATALRHGDLEHYYVSPVRLVRKVLEERPDVRRAFPDPLFADAPALAEWLKVHGTADHFLPPHAPDVFLDKAEGRALARIFSFLTRRWQFMEDWPLGLVGEGRDALASNLLKMLQHGLEYDVDDVLMYLWIAEEQPWAGIPLTIELPVNACRVPSPFLPEGQELLLRPVLGGDPRFRRALERYREEHREPRHRAEDELVRRQAGSSRTAEISVYQALERARVQPRASGMNLFGYHKSPIGLGSMTRGLQLAAERAGIRVQPNVLGNMTMDADLSPRDFLRTFDPALDTNLFVSYPHLHEMLLDTLPKHRVQGRRNIIYLAWEQRDGTHHWRTAYRDFDQVWALSEFAAEAIGRAMEREVLAVPCVVDFDAFPAAASKEEMGIDPGSFAFLYVFDAHSSIERKNPEAALRAFARAFSPGDPVQLLLRASNGQRVEHRERLRRVLRAAPPGLDVKLLADDMPHDQILRLLSAVDCYVSLHRAEGFGYTCAEAMSYGRPVIATGYSGNLQFMTPENSFLVDFREREVEVADGPFQRGSVWADPSVEHAAHLMRKVYEERERAREIAERGRLDVRERLSAEAVGRIVRRALNG